MGAAIKILLSSGEELYTTLHLSRQEVIALINTLNQFAKSVEYASAAVNGELNEKVFAFAGFAYAPIFIICAFYILGFV